MSLLIHGTKLPRSNTMTNAVIRVRQDGTAEIIIHYEHKSESFKLTEIPTPHGRLIVADEIEKCVHEWYDVGEYVFADTIRNADTIIEAEVSENA